MFALKRHSWFVYCDCFELLRENEIRIFYFILFFYQMSFSFCDNFMEDV